MSAPVQTRCQGIVPTALLFSGILLSSTAEAAPADRVAQAAPPPPPVAAQTEPPAPPPASEPAAPAVSPEAAPPADAYQERKEEVVKVTIDRRTKSIQDLAGSAQAFTEADLERKGVTSMRELTAATPYVEVGVQEGNLEIYMRGIGNNNNTEIGDPSSAVHIDGIYIPRPRGLGTMFYDLERVEIALGPQGTLRGRNATAGTMNIVSVQPKLREWSASGTFQYGNYLQRVTKATVNIPLGDRLALRFATFSENRDPFYKNVGGDTNIRATEDANTFSYRASLKWVPTDKISVVLRHDFTFERGTGWSGSNYTAPLQHGLLPDEVPDARSVAFTNIQPSQSLDHLGVSAEINVDLGPLNIELINSFRHLVYRQTTGNTAGINYPGEPAPDLDNYSSSYWLTKSDSVVNELRLFAPDRSRFRWTVGVFNLYESQFVFLGQIVDKANGYAGAEYNEPDMKDGAVAGYADGTFDITKALRAIAGIRVTHDYKHRNGIGYGFGYSGGPARFGTPGFQFAADGRTVYNATGAPNDFLNGIARFGVRDTLTSVLTGPIHIAEQHGASQSTFVDFRLGVEQNPAPNHLLYATFTTGHKAGGFNDTIGSGATAIAPEFGPETVYATEIGSKNEFFDKKVVLNGSAFWYAYQDYQSNSIESVNPTDTSGKAFFTSVRANVGNARIMGVEGDFVGHLPMGLTANVAGAFLDARFLGAKVADSRISYDPTQVPTIDLEGKFLPRAPQLAINYGIAQSIPTSVGYFDWSFSGTTKSTMYMTQFNGNGTDTKGNVNPVFSDIIPWTHRFDASIGYTRPQADIKIEAFIANMTDMTYMTSLINAPGLNLRFFNTPRQFGIRLSTYL